jgi:hypothetical protein
VAQESLHETIGASMLWGVIVRSVELREIAVPPARQAEDDARLLLRLGLRLTRHRTRAAAAEITARLVER